MLLNTHVMEQIEYTLCQNLYHKYKKHITCITLKWNKPQNSYQKREWMQGKVIDRTVLQIIFKISLYLLQVIAFPNWLTTRNYQLVIFPSRFQNLIIFNKIKYREST